MDHHRAHRHFNHCHYFRGYLALWYVVGAVIRDSSAFQDGTSATRLWACKAVLASPLPNNKPRSEI